MRGIGLILAGVVLVACKFTTYTFMVPSAGQILFGSEVANNFAVTNPTTSADQTAVLGVAAVFTRPVTGTVRLEVQKDQQTIQSTDAFTFNPSPGDRLLFHYGLSALPGPGRYVLRVKLGSEVHATGHQYVTRASPGP